MKKHKVAVLGGTGAVGQKFISLLENHPWFELIEIGASPKSAGKRYCDAVNWREQGDIPEFAKNLEVKNCNVPLESTIIFSALDSSVAGEIEDYYAKAGHYVFSNSKNHRMDEIVPILIPEINFDHTELLKDRPNNFIITNANCTSTILALALYPIHKQFKISDILVNSMQAISGAGYPGPSSSEMIGNIVPYIGGEEEKVETELKKIFGTTSKDKIVFSDINISAHCNRVPVIDGHTLTISIKLKDNSSVENIKKCYREFDTGLAKLNLPSCPKNLYNLRTECNRPQPRLDLKSEGGMAISIGRIRECSILDFKLVAFGHNTIRGAAGGSILNAEQCLATGLIK